MNDLHNSLTSIRNQFLLHVPLRQSMQFLKFNINNRIWSISDQVYFSVLDNTSNRKRNMYDPLGSYVQGLLHYLDSGLRAEEHLWDAAEDITSSLWNMGLNMHSDVYCTVVENTYEE